MKTTGTYGAELISVMGDDLTVVNAARVSFDKVGCFDPGTCGECGTIIASTAYCPGCDNETFWGVEPALSDKDAKLIAYLAKHGHWTPFAHPQLSFRVSAPIFVARQLQKHQIGLAWNEVSRRYVDSEPVIYVPAVWRGRADNAKQGSSDEIVTCIDRGKVYGFNSPDKEARHVAYEAVWLYNDLLNNGICPEQARMVLPQSMMTEWVWTGSLAAFARVCNQRLDAHAQRECRPVAESIAEALQKHFPASWEALRTIKEPNDPN